MKAKPLISWGNFSNVNYLLSRMRLLRSCWVSIVMNCHVSCPSLHLLFCCRIISFKSVGAKDIHTFTE